MFCNHFSLKSLCTFNKGLVGNLKAFASFSVLQLTCATSDIISTKRVFDMLEILAILRLL